jgi:hypothetical protein
MPILPRYKVPAGLLATKLLLEWQDFLPLTALMITHDDKQKSSNHASELGFWEYE